MRVLTDEEAHILLLRDVDLVPAEIKMADKLVLRGYLTASVEKEDGENITMYDTTPYGQLALQCYLSFKSSQSIFK